MLSDEVSVAAISTLGGIVVTYLTVKYKDRIVKKRLPHAPKDRMDNIFDGYERLITQLTTDMERKEGSIDRLEGIVQGLEDELAKTKSLLQETKQQLHESQLQRRDMSEQLKIMREEYTNTKDLEAIKKKILNS